MKYCSIPNTDLTPSVLSLGTGDMGGSMDPTTSFQILDRYLASGGTLVDTAKIYNDWIPGETSRSEKLIGNWMKQRKNRGQVILATKGAHPRFETMNIPRLSAQEITADLEASLCNLQVEEIDLYWLHRDDPSRPVQDILDTLHHLVIAGKIRYFGASNWKLDRIQAAQEYAASQGFLGFVAVQNLWNLAHINDAAMSDQTLVGMSDDLWEYHRQNQLAAIPYTSQANGVFQKLDAGRRDRISPQHKAMYLNPITEERFARLQTLKEQTGLTASQITLAYLTSQPFPTIPVIGPHSVAQLDDSMTAGELSLTPDQLAFLKGQ